MLCLQAWAVECRRCYLAALEPCWEAETVPPVQRLFMPASTYCIDSTCIGKGSLPRELSSLKSSSIPGHAADPAGAVKLALMQCSVCRSKTTACRSSMPAAATLAHCPAALPLLTLLLLVVQVMRQT